VVPPAGDAAHIPGLFIRQTLRLGARHDLGLLLLLEIVLDAQFDLLSEKIPFPQLLHDFLLDLFGQALLVGHALRVDGLLRAGGRHSKR
jgi:hypothetical protein